MLYFTFLCPLLADNCCFPDFLNFRAFSTETRQICGDIALRCLYDAGDSGQTLLIRQDRERSFVDFADEDFTVWRGILRRTGTDGNITGPPVLPYNNGFVFLWIP